jgi:hypothetical protein
MLKIWIILILFSIIICANNKPSLTDKQIIELSLNYKFDEAEKLLNKLFNTSDELKNHFLYLNVELIKSIHTAEIVPFKYKRAVKDSVNKILIEYSEKVIKKYEDKKLSIFDKYYLGSIYGMLGRFYGVNRSWYSAFSNGKEGKNILEEVVKENPNFTDVYLLLGMMNYYADRLGGVTEFIAGILGLSGDRKVGLQFLEKVVNNGYMTNWLASMTLAEIYSRLENNDFDALPLLKNLNSKFPDNTYIANWYAIELLNQGLVNEVKKMIFSDEENKITDLVKGKYYHLVGEYKKSNEIYDTLLSVKGMIYPWAYEDGKFSQFLNYVMLDNLKKAKIISQELNESNLSKAEIILQNRSLTKNLIKFKNVISLKNDDAISLINNPPDFKGIKFFEGFYNYCVGFYYFQNSNMKNAEKYFIKSKVADFSNFGFDAIKYLIQIYKTTNADRENVSKLIDEIDDLDNDALEFSAQDLEAKYDL